jgi:hypothetical protein
VRAERARPGGALRVGVPAAWSHFPDDRWALYHVEERVLLKTVHRLVHKPTLELRAAAEADDRDLVSVLAGLFDATPPTSGASYRQDRPTDW